jgi:imidazolonepropionase-like amidohydrolase
MRESHGDILRRVLTRLLFGLAALAAWQIQSAELLPPGHRPNAQGTHFLRGATIFTKPGERIEHGAVLIRDGRIEGVGSDLQAPADARVWDLSGMTIYPGFVDPYLTLKPSTNVLGFQSFADQNENDTHEPRASGLNFYGVTGQEKDPGKPGPGYHIGQVTPERLMAENLGYDANATMELRELGFTAGNIVPEKGVVRGVSALVLLGDEGPNRSIVRRAVAQHVGFEVNSQSADAYPRSLMGAIAAVRQSFFDAQNYSRNGETRKDVNLALEALLPAATGEMPVVFEPGSVLMVDRAARVAAELGLQFQIVASGQEWRRPELMRQVKGAFIVPLQFPDVPKLPSDDDWGTVSLDNLRAWDWAPENAALLRKEKREVAVTLYGLAERKNFRKNLRAAMDRGLSEPDALAALTIVPATICGAEKELGTIESGKVANLTVVAGSYFNPADKIQDVWVKGRPFRVATDASTPKNEARKDDEKAAEKASLTANRTARSPQEGRGPLATPKAVLVKNATIWTSAKAGILKETDLLIVDGKIREIGKDLNADDANVLDASGKHVTAGLIDCHSHAMVVGNVNEMTVPSSAMVRIADVVNSETRRIEEELAGGLTVANLLHGSANPIGGQNCVIKLRDGASPEELKFEGAPSGIKFALGENVKQSNWGAERATRFPQSRMGVPTFMANRFTAARAYQTAWKNWEQKRESPEPRRDLELETLSEILRGERLIHCHSYRQDEIVAFLRTMESFGIRVATLQHVLEGYKVADEIAKHGAGASCFSDWWAYKFEVFDAIPFAGAIMHDRNVVVSFNSDSSDLSRRLYSEAAKALKYGGVSEAEALKFVTINPAKQLRIDSRVGSLEPGKDGDFVIWSRSPLEAGALCEQTWIEGKKYFDRAAIPEKAKALQDEREKLLVKAKKAAGLSKPEESSSNSKAAQAAFFSLPWELQFEHVDRHCDSH